MRTWRRTVALAAGVGLAFVATASAASSPAVIDLKPGDQLKIGGSDLICAVSTRSPVTIVCGPSTVGANAHPKGQTYGIAVADTGIALLNATSPQNPTLVRRESEPAIKGAFFPAPSRASLPSLRVGGGTTLLFVGGTHVLCAVTQQHGSPAVTCGVGTGKGTSVYTTPSYVAVVDDSAAILSHAVTPDAITTVVAKHQPTG